MIKRYKKNEIKKLVEILKNDGVIAVPTDTVYGLCSDMNSKKARKKLKLIKERLPNKSFPIMCSDIEQVKKIAIVTEQIEKIQVGDPVVLIRERDNRYNPNNFMIQTIKGHDIGNMPAELCNVIAPLYDAERFEINSSEVSFVEPISKRSRHAKQAILFVELKGRLL